MLIKIPICAVTNVQLIDMHTHMFNARYLPLKGIFRASGISDEFVTPLANFCWFLTNFSKFISEKRTMPLHQGLNAIDTNMTPELETARSIESYIQALAQDCQRLIMACQNEPYLIIDLKKITPAIDNQAHECSKMIDTNFSGTVAVQLLASIMNTYDCDELLFESDHISEISPKCHRFELNESHLSDFLKDFLRKAFSTIEDVLDYVDFFWNLTHSEEEILHRIDAYYSALGIKYRLVHHMMDMSHPYAQKKGYKDDGHVKISFYPENKPPSQLSQMNNLQLKSKKRLSGFSAFDPYRFAKQEADESKIIAHLDMARNQFGMLGFKFYPPLGYNATDNTNTDLQYAIDVFLKYCVMHDVPVFTHCAPTGFELVKGVTGQNSDPVFWRKALENKSWIIQDVKNKTPCKKIECRNLRLCFGHAGGGRFVKNNKTDLISAGWVADDSEWRLAGNYASQIVKLCKEFPRVYCELANIDSILDNNIHAKNMRHNLIREMNDHGNDEFFFSDKIMYGTDWHMVGMVNDVVKYFYKLYGMFDDPKLKQFIPNFFCGNAVAYLKLV